MSGAVPPPAADLPGADLPAAVDVVVVGAGAAGCVVAARAARAGLDVLLVEAGAAAPSPRAGFLDIGPDSRVAGHVPATLRGADLVLPRGRTLGGSGAVNGGYCVAHRPADLAGWPGRGPGGTRWEDAMSGGLARVTERLRPGRARPTALSRLVDRAFPATGVPVAQARRDGVRRTAWTAWDPAGSGARCVTGRPVTGLLWRGGREAGVCAGVVFADGREVRARETVLAAGGIGSAALLLASGVDARTGHPVGESAREHPELLLGLGLPPGFIDADAAVPGEEGLPPLLPRVHELRVPWPRGGPAHGAGATVELRPYAVPLDVVVGGLAPQEHRVGLALMTPGTRATVRLDARGGPVVGLDTHHDPADDEVLRDAEALARERFAAIGVPTGDGVLGTSQHLASSAPIGPVLDSHGRLHGVPGVRVVDSAALPELPPRGPYLTVLALAEVLADALLADLAADPAAGAPATGAEGTARAWHDTKREPVPPPAAPSAAGHRSGAARESEADDVTDLRDRRTADDDGEAARPGPDEGGAATVEPRVVTVTGGAGTLVGDVWEPPRDDARRAEPRDELLMLHGGAQTRHSWSRAARRLAGEGYRVTCMDARGHGDSDWAADGDYEIHRMSEDLERIVAELYPGRKPVLVGASLGGLTGMLALGTGKDVARALVLVDVTPRLESAGVERIGEFMRSGLDGFASLDEVADAVAAYQPHRTRTRNPEGLRKNVRQKADGRWYWHWDPRFVSNASAENAELGNRFFTELVPHITVPTLLIRGGRSDIVSDETTRHLRELLPHAHTHEVPDAGHMVAGDDNAVFLDQLEWFLETVVAGE